MSGVQQYSFFGMQSGLFHVSRYQGPLEMLAVNTPAGHQALPGSFDRACQRVELRPDDFGDAVVPVVVDYQPPAPPDDGLMTWAWNTETKRWVGTPTLAALAAQARGQRDALMSRYDWVTLRAMRTGQPLQADWAAYLQALADVPAQAGFPLNIVWPEPPAAQP